MLVNVVTSQAQETCNEAILRICPTSINYSDQMLCLTSNLLSLKDICDDNIVKGLLSSVHETCINEVTSLDICGSNLEDSYSTLNCLFSNQKISQSCNSTVYSLKQPSPPCQQESLKYCENYRSIKEFFICLNEADLNDMSIECYKTLNGFNHCLNPQDYIDGSARKKNHTKTDDEIITKTGKFDDEYYVGHHNSNNVSRLDLPDSKDAIDDEIEAVENSETASNKVISNSKAGNHSDDDVRSDEAYKAKRNISDDEYYDKVLPVSSPVEIDKVKPSFKLSTIDLTTGVKSQESKMFESTKVKSFRSLSKDKLNSICWMYSLSDDDESDLNSKLFGLSIKYKMYTVKNSKASIYAIGKCFFIVYKCKIFDNVFNLQWELFSQ